MIVGGLAVDVTAYPNNPAIAETPTQEVVGMQFLSRALVSGGIAQIEVIHHLDVAPPPDGSTYENAAMGSNAQ